MAASSSSSKLFTPLAIANGRIELQHRVVMAPMTRNRGVPLSSSDEGDTPSAAPNRVWVPDELVALYYEQRASPGGLLITEGIPPSIEASGMPHVPGLFHAAQAAGWRRVVSAVHGRGGFVYAQLWHAGRATVPQMTGTAAPLSASATPWDDADEKYPFRDPATGEKVAYRDHPPVAMTADDMRRTVADYVAAARTAMDVGFDGVEINGGNGNLLDQFLHSNINRRTDAYGGSVENRCRFPLELVSAVAAAVGAGNVGLRLEPACLYQHTRGAERVETWSHLCRRLAEGLPIEQQDGGSGEEEEKRRRRLGLLSYVHFIEPRFDRIESEAEREGFYASWSLPERPVSNEPFARILRAAGIPCLSCGGWGGDGAAAAAVDEGRWDAVVFARWFASNPDLPSRLRNGHPLAEYDRSRFYGSWDGVRENGYTTYPTYEEELQKASEKGTGVEAK
ncbi:hypothetical protein GGR56DRAFT_671117 [Xylariaceae sp. FL0804]|nr:hypothetical protein GGR56DRAFT_671117 [Xylariaceae sp. FL0804]